MQKSIVLGTKDAVLLIKCGGKIPMFQICIDREKSKFRFSHRKCFDKNVFSYLI